MRATRDPTVCPTSSPVSQRARQTAITLLHAIPHENDLSKLLADDVVLTIMETGETFHGRKAIVDLLHHLSHEAFAAEHSAIVVAAEGCQAVVEAEFAGRHVGEFAGVSPTGRHVHLPFAFGCDVAGNHIAALRLYLSLDALVRQIR